MTEGSQPAERSLDVAQLVVKHQVSVWRYLRSLGCLPSEADDLTQETFLKVFERPFEPVSDKAAIAYLRKVAKHLLIDRRRKEGRQVSEQTVTYIDQFWDNSGQSKPDELLELLDECLQGLTDRARKALSLRFRDGKSRQEIAQELNIGEHGAKNLMQRAKQQLRECLEFKIRAED